MLWTSTKKYSHSKLMIISILEMFQCMSSTTKERTAHIPDSSSTSSGHGSCHLAVNIHLLPSSGENANRNWSSFESEKRPKKERHEAVNERTKEGLKVKVILNTLFYFI